MYAVKQIINKLSDSKCGGFLCARKFEVGCHGLEVKIKLVLATIGL